MNRWLVVSLCAPLFFCAQARALEVDVQRYDASVYAGQGSFTVLSATKNVVFLNQCTRAKLARYEWSIWEGNYGVEATVQAVATIVVKRQKEDSMMSDTVPFILKAMQAAAESGGNLLCQVRWKRDRNELGIESMIFRAYKQFFRSGNVKLSDYYHERTKAGRPLTLADVKEDQQLP